MVQADFYTDFTVYLYLAITVISVAGVILFIADWLRLGAATKVYKYITLLLLGHAIKQSVEIYSIYIRESGRMEDFLNFIHSPFWDLRMLFIIVPLAMLVGKMYWRTFIRLKTNRNLGRRHNDD